MPSDSNGNYSLPPGYLAVTGETIQASQHNPPLEDLATAVTGRLPRNGASPMTGPLRLADGTVGAPSLLFSSGDGWFKTATGWGLSISGILTVEFGSAGISTGVTSNSIPDKAVSLRKLYHPSGPSKLLGSNSNPALTITGAADNGGGLIRLTVADSSTFATGQQKTVSDVLGTIEANGTWSITVVDATHIDLQGSSFATTYISGGTIGGGFEEIDLGAGLQLTGKTLSAPATPRGYLFGLTLSNGTDAVNDINIAAGKCRDALDTATITLPAITKQLDSAWAAGTNAGGRSSAALADGTWHVFAIAKADGTADVLFHTAVDPSLVLPTGYTVYRRIGSILRESSSIVGFVQDGELFQRKTSILDVSSSVDLNAVTWALSIPTGIRVAAHVLFSLSSSRTDFTSALLSDLSLTDQIPAVSNSQVIVPRNGNDAAAVPVTVMTNTSRQIRSRVGNVAGAAGTHNITIHTRGWSDARGRDAP